MSVTSSNSSSNNICRYCNVDLVVGTNTNRKEKKTCNDCLAKTKELKTEKPNTIKCNKCLLYKDNMEFYKILKNCVSCRSKTTKNRNKRNGKQQEADYSAEAANVTIKQIFR